MGSLCQCPDPGQFLISEVKFSKVNCNNMNLNTECANEDEETSLVKSSSRQNNYQHVKSQSVSTEINNIFNDHKKSRGANRRRLLSDKLNLQAASNASINNQRSLEITSNSINECKF